MRVWLAIYRKHSLIPIVILKKVELKANISQESYRLTARPLTQRKYMEKSFKDYIEKKEKNNIIETGYNISDSFWEDFLLVLNNGRGLSDLLGVSRSKVSTWNKKINEAIKDHKNKKTELKVNKKQKIIKTGRSK
jgi:hypothetical protein